MAVPATSYKVLGRIVFWAGWPVSWIYLRWSRRARVLVLCGEEVLVVENWLGNGKLGLPGGGLGKHEDPAAGAVRELREETGVLVDPEDLQLLGSGMYQSAGHRYWCAFFAVRVAAMPETATRPLEIITVTWVPRNSIVRKVHGDDVSYALRLLDSKGDI